MIRWIDDILIRAKNIEDLIGNVQRVFEVFVQ